MWGQVAGNFIVTTKIDVAERQLETAILLFFLDEDPVSVHTLTSASNDVLQDLCKHYHDKSVIDEWLDVIKAERKDEVRKMMRDPQNYFKHADKDPEGNFRFYYEATAVHIFQAVETYLKLTKKISPTMLTFKVWFYLNDPLIILNNNQRTCFLDATKDIDPKDKKQFLKLIPMCEKSRIDAVESSLLNLNK